MASSLSRAGHRFPLGDTGVDTRLLVLFLTILFAACAATIGLGVGTGDIFVASLLTVGLIGLVLIVKPQVASFAVVACYASGLTAPGAPRPTRSILHGLRGFGRRDDCVIDF